MNSDIHLIEWLRLRLTFPLPGLLAQERMLGRVIPSPITAPPHARPSAVLCLLFAEDNLLKVLLMKRREDRTAHSAQVSFPGGKAEPEDADMLATALREANEELGIDPHQLQILGALTSLYIPVSNFNVFPYVAYMPSRPQYIVNRAEVAYPIETFVSHLLSDDNKVITDVSSPAVPDKIRQVKAYKLDDGTIVWGATAMIISELETAIKEYNQGSI